MQQPVLVGKDLDERTKRLDILDFAFVDCSDLGNGNDPLDLVENGIPCCNIVGNDIDNAEFADFLDYDCCTGFALHFLYDLSAGADNGADKFTGYLDLGDAGHEWFVICTRFGNCPGHFTKDMHSTAFCLFQRFFQYIVGKAVAFNVHLAGSDAVGSTANLEVHIAKMVLIAKDIGKDCIFTGFCIGHQPHGNTGNGLFNLNTGIHQRKCPCTDRCHGRRTVGFLNIRNNTDGIGKVIMLGEHSRKGPFCQHAVADLPSACAADGLHFPGCKGREIVMQHKICFAFNDCTVDYLLIELCSEGYRGE